MDRIDDKGRRFMTQSTSAVGVGSDSFQAAYEGIYAIAERLGRHANDGGTPSWNEKLLHSFSTIRASNRYFTWKNSDNVSPAMPFHLDVDPQKTLSAMAGDNYEHTQDNEVDYMVCTVGQDGKLM